MGTMLTDDIERLLRTAPILLLSGPVETRLTHDFNRPSPGGASFVQMFDREGHDALRSIYAGYMIVARDHGLPMVVDTPTWRAHPDALSRHGFVDAGDLRRVNETAVRLIRDIRRDLGLDGLVAVAGTVGPRHDGYDPSGAPAPLSARAYHRAQIEALVGAGVDLLYAPTFPSGDELLGVALAFAATGLPYVLAPTIDALGCLPDGSPLQDAMERIAAGAVYAPSIFAVSCVHPSTLSEARRSSNWPRQMRVTGIAANGSEMPHHMLDGIDHVESDCPAVLAKRLVGLHHDGLRLIGGCCGTTDEHLRAFASLVGPAANPDRGMGLVS